MNEKADKRAKNAAALRKITSILLLSASVLLYPPYYFGFYLTLSVKSALMFGFAVADSVAAAASLGIRQNNGERLNIREVPEALLCPACILLYETGGIAAPLYGMCLCGMLLPLLLQSPPRTKPQGSNTGRFYRLLSVPPLILLFLCGLAVAALNLLGGLDATVLPMIYLAPVMLLSLLWARGVSRDRAARSAACLIPLSSALYVIAFAFGVSSFRIGALTVKNLIILLHYAAFLGFCAVFAVKSVKTIAKRVKMCYNYGGDKIENHPKTEGKIMANEKIKGCGFHHIALTASDFEKSKKFYTELGFKLLVGWGEGKGEALMFDMGDGSNLELFASGSPEIPETGKWQHFALKCDDPDSAYELALKAGATPLTPPKTVPLESRPHKMTLHIAFVKGPDGEQIEFFKVL